MIESEKKEVWAGVGSARESFRDGRVCVRVRKRMWEAIHVIFWKAFYGIFCYKMFFKFLYRIF